MTGLRSLAAGLAATTMIMALGAYIVLANFAEALPDDPVIFNLPDAYGRIVSSHDYAGVPIFLEFGACW
jgi:hypothetical protein